MRLLFLLSLVLLTAKVDAQKKYHFSTNKMEVVEPYNKKDTSYFVSLLADSILRGNQIDSLRVFDERSGDAGPRDYSISTSMPLTILMHSGSQQTVGFFLQIKTDTLDEIPEDVILTLKYKSRNHNNTTDSVFTDTLVLIIKNAPKSSSRSETQKSIDELEKAVFQNTFLLLDTSYRVTIRDTIPGHKMIICKTKDNGIAQDRCDSVLISSGIEESDFVIYFKRLLSNVGTLDSTTIKSVPQADKIAIRNYLEWKNFTGNTKLKISTLKESASNDAKFNAALAAITQKVDAFIKTADTSYSYIGSTLSTIPLYRRKIERISYPKKGIIDPISAPYDNIEYIKTGDTTINFDSMAIRIDDGFLERLTLHPIKKDIETFSLNNHTTIKKHYDLRNTTDAIDILNMYIPLESRRAYIKIRERKRTSKTDSTYKIPGYADYKSKDNPRYYYYSPYFVRLGDVLQYNANPDSLPDVLRHLRNINLTFRSNQSTRIRLKDKDFNSFSQLNIFTDLIGFSEDKPNGLIQAEGKFETGIFSQPVWNNNYYSKVKLKLLPSAYASFTISKVENKLRYYIVPKDSVILYNEVSKKFDDTTNRRRAIRNTDIIQYANLLLNARFNLISIESDFVHIKFYLEGGIIRTAVNDTTNGTDNLGNAIVKDSKSILNSLKTSWGITIKLKSTSKLGVDFGIEWQRTSLNNNLLTQVSTRYNRIKRQEELQESIYRGFPNFQPQIIIPNVNIYYYLDKDFKNRLYIRGKYFKELRSRSDNLFFVQFGYSTDLNGFFGLFKKSES